MFEESKDEIALVVFGTTNTANPLADGDQYENITVARPLSLPDWALVQYVQKDLQPTNVSADCILLYTDVEILVACMNNILLEKVCTNCFAFLCVCYYCFLSDSNIKLLF